MIDLKNIYDKYPYKDKVNYLEWLELKLIEEVEENDKLYKDIEELMVEINGV